MVSLCVRERQYEVFKTNSRERSSLEAARAREGSATTHKQLDVRSVTHPSPFVVGSRATMTFVERRRPAEIRRQRVR